MAKNIYRICSLWLYLVGWQSYSNPNPSPSPKEFREFLEVESQEFPGSEFQKPKISRYNILYALNCPDNFVTT